MYKIRGQSVAQDTVVPELTSFSLPVSAIGRGKTTTSLYDNKSVVLIQDHVNHNHPEIKALINYVGRFKSLEPVNFNWMKDKSFARQLTYVKESLLWYERHIPTRKGRGIGILYQNLVRGPDFADEVDDAIKYSMRLSSASSVVYGVSDFPSIADEVKSLDDFYSPYHLVRFSQKESDDIYEITKDTCDIHETLRARFEEKVSDLCYHPKERVFELDDLSRLEFLTSAVTFDPQTKKRPKKVEAFLYEKSFEMTSNFQFGYVQVFKEPHEARACVVPDPNTLVTLRVIERRMEQVISCPSDKIREKDFSFLPEYLSDYSKWIFLQSDQKKCGLTFPLKLIMEFYRILHKQFPTMGFDLIEKGYSSASLWKDGEVLQFRRGVGLGMMNSTISIIMGILFEIWAEDQDPDLRLNGMFYNDDQVIRIRVTTKQDRFSQPIKELGESWDRWLESFGLSIHKKKPFISNAGVFLEVYGEGFPINTEKKVQKVCNLFKSLFKPTIVDAKEHFSSVVDSLPPEMHHYVPEILGIVVSYWGHEFDPIETTLPSCLGGWITPREKGFDLSLKLITQQCSHWWDYTSLLRYKPQREIFSKKKVIPNSRKNFLEFVEQIPESSSPINYKRLAKSAVSSGRPDKKTTLVCAAINLRKRQKLWKERKTSKMSPLELDDFFFEKIDEGVRILYPFKVSDERKVIFPQRSMENGSSTDSPTRLLLSIDQQTEKLGVFKIINFKNPSNLCTLWYALAAWVQKECHYVPTPVVMHLALKTGSTVWEELSLLSYEDTNSLQSRLRDHPFTKTIMSWYMCESPDETILVDHDRKIAIGSGFDVFLPGWPKETYLERVLHSKEKLFQNGDVNTEECLSLLVQSQKEAFEAFYEENQIPSGFIEEPDGSPVDDQNHLLERYGGVEGFFEFLRVVSQNTSEEVHMRNVLEDPIFESDLPELEDDPFGSIFDDMG